MAARKLLQINPVLRTSTSTGRIVREIGDVAMRHGWESYIAYSRGRDGIMACTSHTIPVGGKADVAAHGLATRLLDRHGLASTLATKNLIRQIEAVSPDIIHLHNLHGYYLNYRVLFGFLARSGIPVVWTIHDCWPYTGHCYYYSYARCDKWLSGCGHCPQRRLFPASWLVDRSARNYADKHSAFTSLPPEQTVIVPVSEWMRGEMEQSFFRSYDFRVIHNGIDTETFRPTGDSGVRARYGLGGGHIVLGVASVWSREKGLDDFMELSRRLGDGYQTVLVGVDKDTLRHLPRNIVGISRTANASQLAELYSAATAFVNPTWQDNYPTVNLEAMACGTPVVTYRTGGSVEAVTAQTGLTVAQGDLDGIIRAVHTIVHRGKDFYRSACRSHAVEFFRKDDCYARYIRLYEELLYKHTLQP